MAKLSAGRMSDSTRLGKVDDAHNELETDLEAIFGIPDETPISNPVFGGTVNNDGSIEGVPVMKSAGQQSDPEDAVGFEFDDGSERKRLVLVDSSLEIHRWDSTAGRWELIANIERPGSGRLQDLSDVEIAPADMIAGKFLAVNGDNDAFVLVDPAEGDGITSFTQLDEAPYTKFLPGQSFDTDDIGKLLAIDPTGNKFEFVDPPDGVGAPICHWMVSPGPLLTRPGWPSGSWVTRVRWGDSQLVTGFVSAATYENSGDNVNQIIRLDEGVYRIGVTFRQQSGSKYGVRAWRIVSGLNIFGPAANGLVQAAVASLTDSGFQAPPTGVVQDLGSSWFVVVEPNQPLEVQLYQNSGESLVGVDVYCWIYKVK